VLVEDCLTVMSGGCSGSAHPSTLVHGCRMTTVVAQSLPSPACSVQAGLVS